VSEHGKDGGKRTTGTEREARLAAELRANLKKRKQRNRNAKGRQVRSEEDTEKPE